MKMPGRVKLPLISISALSVALWTLASCGVVGPSTDAQALGVDVPPMVEKANFPLDEVAGTARVSGGVPAEVVAELAGGAELGATGKSATALKLNGTSAYAATAGPVVDTTKSFSVSVWAKLDNRDRNHTFLSQAGDRASGFQLYYSKGLDKWVFNRHAADTDNTAIVRALSRDVAQAGVWTHLTGSYDAEKQTISLFVNGQLQQTTAFTSPWRSNGGLQIGRVHYRSGWQENMAGLIDDLRLVQSAVTPADAQALANGQLPTHLQELATFTLDEKPESARVSGGKGAGSVATLAGDGVQLGVPGKSGTALHLNGTSGYAATATPLVDTTRSFSVSAWVMLDNRDRNHTFLSQAGDRASGFQLYYSKDLDKWVFNRHASDTDNTAIIRSISVDAAQAGVWTELTGVYDDTAKTIQLFVNGKAQTAAAFTTPWQARSALQIGRLLYKGAWQEHFVGTIDNIRISDRSSPAKCHRSDVVGHRGAPKLAPENTIASLQAAIDRGADWIETDVQFTKDGQPVIMHDATVDRMTNGKGRIDQLSAEEISKLTVIGGGHVPTLEEVLTLLKGRTTRLLLEIKGTQTPASVDHALRLVSEAGLTQRTMAQSFDEDVVRYAAASPYKTKIALLRDNLDTDPVATARKFSLSAYAVNFKGLSVSPAAVDQLKSAGVEVFVWTVDRDSDWQAATTWGVDGIITNRADELIQWRNALCTTK
ncbi:glycerophosphodiester phosphodiesterase family protein [Streptomyces sp. NPDC058000]|uniref:glycerophosphodiester phosphodiesterase family protein n=1 Tax=Streptomyces sp. NPDC058000 TaxID=3346299 RepID=UPI0036EB6CBE